MKRVLTDACLQTNCRAGRHGKPPSDCQSPLLNYWIYSNITRSPRQSRTFFAHADLVITSLTRTAVWMKRDRLKWTTWRLQLFLFQAIICIGSWHIFGSLIFQPDLFFFFKARASNSINVFDHRDGTSSFFVDLLCIIKRKVLPFSLLLGRTHTLMQTPDWRLWLSVNFNQTFKGLQLNLAYTSPLRVPVIAVMST